MMKLSKADWLVGLVGLGLVVYLGAVQPSRYETEALLRISGGASSSGADVLSALGVVRGDGVSDGVIRYLQSRELSGLFYREFKGELQDEFGGRWVVDPLNARRLESEQDFYEFYSRWLRVEVDSGGVVGVWLTDYDGKRGAKWLTWLVAKAQEKVESVSGGMLREQVKRERVIVEELRGSLIKAEVELAEFSRGRGSVFYEERLKSEGQLAAGLRVQLVQAELELEGKKGFVAKDSGEMLELEAKVKGLRGQLKGLEGIGKSEGLRDDVVAYARLKATAELLKVQTGKRAMELEGLEAQLKRAQVEVGLLSGPVVSDGSVYPKRGWNVFLVVGGLGLFGWMRRAGRKLS